MDGARSAEKLVTLNAWNEWTEGSYLLPDSVHGTAYLQAVKAVVGGKTKPAEPAMTAAGAPGL